MCGWHFSFCVLEQHQRRNILLALAALYSLHLLASKTLAAGELTGVWNGFLGQVNVVECVNLAEHGGTFALALRADDGHNLGLRQFLLPGRGTSHTVLNEYAIEGAYGTYDITQINGSPHAAIRCITMLYRMAADARIKQIEYAFSLPALTALQGISAGVYNSMNPEQGQPAVQNWLSLVNLGTEPFRAMIEVYDQAGELNKQKSFFAGELLPGRRTDIALGHEDGQIVGLYRIVPASSNMRYAAFLSRYSARNAGSYRFAFALPAQPGSSTPGPVSISTMAEAINWGEIANPTAEEETAEIEVFDQTGTLKHRETVVINPFSQYHLLINHYLGKNNVGLLNVHCASCTGTSGRLLVQSLFYGRGAPDSTAVEWAYAAQAGLFAPAGQVVAGAFVNTFLGAANWNKILNAGKTPFWFSTGWGGGTAARQTFGAYQISAPGSLDLPLHEQAGPNAVGLGLGSFQTDGKGVRTELIRVYPRADGQIGYIMNIPGVYLNGKGDDGTQNPEDEQTPPEDEPDDENDPPGAEPITLVDLSSYIQASTEGETSTLDRVTRVLTSTATIRLTNTSEIPVLTPLHAVITMTAPGVVMPGALGGPGTEPYQRYYFDLSTAAGETFEPGQSVTFQGVFQRQAGVRFQYSVTPYGRLGQIEANLPPVINVEPLTAEVAQGGTVLLAVSASDPNGDPVSISSGPKLANAAFSVIPGTAPSGTYAFSPAAGQRGKYLVSFTARDPEGALAQQSAEITVAGVNHAPQLEVPAAQTVNEGGLLVFQLQTTDEDGDAVDVAAAGLPENAVFIAATNTMTFAPEYGQQGQYQVSFSATDGLLSSAPVTVDITVLDVQPGQGGQPTELILEVDQVQNPTLLTTARISGAVNGGGGLPPVQQPVSALINTVSPAQAEQGASLEVELKSTDALFPAHFAQGQSQVNFGAGITVNAVSVLSSGQLKAAITIDSSAAPGIRAISVQTGNETAVSLVAFRVVRGRAIITGLLRDPETGAALPGAMVGIQGTGIQVVSGADGRFTLFDVPAGRQTLLVNAPDHQFFTLEIDAQLGETTDTGTIGSSATVFDPTAPAAASLVSVLGRGAARSISTLSKEGLRQLIIDTLILTGGDEGGVVDEYGNQLNPSVNGESLISVTLKGVDVLADRLLKDESFALVDLLFSAAHGYEWGGILGRPLTLDELLAIIQQQVNAAWADPLNPENALALVVFNPGTTVTPQPPVIDRTTRLNALQMYILASSLLIDMQWRMDNLQASAAGQNSTRRRMLAQLSELFLSNAYAQIRPPGRYTRFWRGGFNDSYATAMIKQGTQVLAETAALFALLPAGGLAGANFGSHIAGRYGTDMTAMMMALQTSLRVPEAPKIISFKRTTAGLVFTYDPVDPASNVLTLMRFDSPTAKPLIVDMTVIRELTPKEKKAGMVIDPTHVIDRSPPVSGSAYYAMTGTWGRYNENTATKAGLSRSVIAPWWGAGTAPSAEGDTRGAYLTYWLSQQSVIYTSEYSLPVVYIADPLPQLEAINSIAVDPKTDEVYVNEPPAARISKITKKFGQLDEQLFFANTNFPSPGAQGLAISSGPVLYADNSASDAQFGGRIFSWNAKGQREFRGTMNYFSQILMFANPVSVGPLAMAPDGGLYAFERLGRDVRRVPVNATYDPNRRTGQFVVRIPDDGRGTLIDLEVQTAQAKQGVIYMLDGRGVSALQLPTKKLPLASVGRFKLQ